MTRNTEMVAAPDIIDWLREQRDTAAVKRRRFFDEIQRRDDAVKLGTLKAEEAALPNREDTLAANAQDALALRYFTALSEIEKSRKIIDEMTVALKARGHYVAAEEGS